MKSKKSPTFKIVLVVLILIIVAILVHINSKPKFKVYPPDPVLTEVEADTLVKTTWGDCDPATCTNLVVTTRQAETSKNIVTAIYTQKSSSVASIKKTGNASIKGTTWSLGKAFETRACLAEHGHEIYSNTPCTQ